MLTGRLYIFPHAAQSNIYFESLKIRNNQYYQNVKSINSLKSYKKHTLVMIF